ncbi:hypothetical protein MPC4_350026 [Methylocella tundrae]|uniref:Uncharacterized protein n=1 Tax=Methylocella tundrae TaxID=227605 RepID=A0A8B6M8U4_METTU|nr:hypothetical protein MPC4_350026 [Methylocella tundrae]
MDPRPGIFSCDTVRLENKHGGVHVDRIHFKAQIATCRPISTTPSGGSRKKSVT